MIVRMLVACTAQSLICHAPFLHEQRLKPSLTLHSNTLQCLQGHTMCSCKCCIMRWRKVCFSNYYVQYAERVFYYSSSSSMRIWFRFVVSEVHKQMRVSHIVPRNAWHTTNHFEFMFRSGFGTQISLDKVLSNVSRGCRLFVPLKCIYVN